MIRKSFLFVYWLTANTSLAFQGLTAPSLLQSQPSHPTIPSDNQEVLSGSSAPFTVPNSLITRKMTSPDDSQPSSTPDTNENGIVRTVFHAVGATTSGVVAGSFFLVLAYQRDALMVSMFVGSIGNAITGKILKRILNQERPAELESADIKLKPGDKGMPSSHAMSLGFIGTFTWLTLPWTQIPIVIYSLISLAYRIDIKLHTWQQVAVGFVVGSTNGVMWRYLCDGRNPFHINIMDMISQTVLNQEGLLPIPFLVVPAIVGAIIVGSVERRIAGWLKKAKGE